MQTLLLAAIQHILEKILALAYQNQLELTRYADQFFNNRGVTWNDTKKSWKSIAFHIESSTFTSLILLFS